MRVYLCPEPIASAYGMTICMSICFFVQALKHASIAAKHGLEICWVEASDLEPPTKVYILHQYNRTVGRLRRLTYSPLYHRTMTQPSMKQPGK